MSERSLCVSGEVHTMSSSTITTKDGTEIYYKDWGKGPVVTFSHGWPLNSDAWDGQMLFLAQNGFRVVAHDRRGHGRSSQASSGNDMDGYADDLAAVIEALDLKDASAGGPLHRRRRSRPLHRAPRDEAGRQSGPHRRRATDHAEDPPPIRRACRSKSSTTCVRASSRTARNSTRIWPCRSMAPTGRAPRSRRACSISSGSGACRPASRTPTKASRPSPRPISPRTSRSSMSRPWSCTARTTRSFPSRTRR